MKQEEEDLPEDVKEDDLPEESRYSAVPDLNLFIKWVYGILKNLGIVY